MRILLSFSLILLWSQVAPRRDLQIEVPQNSPAVMIDGVFSEGEWQKAAQLEVPGTADLYFQRSPDFVYIAVRYTKSASGIVDLYLSPQDGEIYDLHASAKLGERQLRGGAFPDWSWWNNRDWAANVSHVDSFERLVFCLLRSANIRFGVRVFPRRSGGCDLN